MTRRAPRIRKLRRRADVAGLLDALTYTNPIPIGNGAFADAGITVRLQALEALANLATIEHVPGIAHALGDPEPSVRQMAVRVVRALGPSRCIDALAMALTGPSQAEFAEARFEALAALEGLAKDGEGEVPRRVAMAVAQGGDEVALDQVTQDALTGLVADASTGEVTRLVDELIERLPTMNGSLEYAQVVLSWLGSHSVKPLVEALGREGGFREPAVSVLGAIRDSRALEPLAGVLEDRRVDVRQAAAWALGELRDPRAAEPLMQATMDDEYAVRRQAGEALDEMGSIALMAGVANMIRSLEDRSDGPTVARLVEEGLERTPPSKRHRHDGPPRWAPRFIERFQLRQHT